MAILEGGVRFPVDPLLLSTLRFYGLCPDQLPSNFYRVVSCVSKLNQIYGLQLNYHDINFMYSLCGNLKTNYYLKARDVRVQLISCLFDSNRNSTGEYVRVSSNWLANELPCPLSSRSWSVPSTFNSFDHVSLMIASLEQALTNFCTILLQMAKCLIQTLKGYM